MLFYVNVATGIKTNKLHLFATFTLLVKEKWCLGEDFVFPKLCLPLCYSFFFF